MTKGEPWLTDDEKEEIRQVVREQRLFGYDNEDATKIASERLKKKFGRREAIVKQTYINLKTDEADRNEVTNWITVYTTKGYLDSYRQWIEETIYSKQKLLALFEYMTSKPLEEQEKLSGKINSTARSIREATILHSSLGLGAPMILQMKNAIDKGQIDEFLPKREFTRDKESGEDSNQDIPRDQYSA